MTSEGNKEAKTHYNVLSIDGGGIRGILPAAYIQAIEKKMGLQAHQIFHTIGGTSTGSIVSAFLSVPRIKKKPEDTDIMKAKEVVDFYIKKGPRIFHKPPSTLQILSCLLTFVIAAYYMGREILHILDSINKDIQKNPEEQIPTIFYIFSAIFATVLFECLFYGYWLIRPLFASKFGTFFLRRAFLESFPEETTLANSEVNLGIVSTEETYVQPFVFNSMRAKIYGEDDILHGTRLYKAIRCSSAAPTYFNSVHFKNENVSTDSENSTYWASLDAPKYTWKCAYHQDGGVMQNNPSQEMLELYKAERRRKGEDPKNERVTLLSLSTGSKVETRDPTRYDSSQETKRDEAERLFFFLLRKLTKSLKLGSQGIFNVIRDRLIRFSGEIAIKAYNVHCKMVYKFKGEGEDTGYFRPFFLVDNDELDDTSKENMEELIRSANHEVYINGEDDSAGYTPYFENLIANLWKGVDKELRPVQQNSSPSEVNKKVVTEQQLNQPNAQAS